MKDYVKVTTDFGPDLVFATVVIENGQATVKDWHMDGRRRDVSELSAEQHQLLCSLAEESPRNRKVKYTVLGIFGEDNTRGFLGNFGTLEEAKERAELFQETTGIFGFVDVIVEKTTKEILWNRSKNSTRYT